MMLKSTRVANVHLYSTGLSEEEWAISGVYRAESPIQAIVESVGRSGDTAIAVIPEGPYVLTKVEST